MKVIIKTETYEVPVTSVYLANDLDDLENKRLKMFFCYNCQSPITQYRGRVTTIIPGEPIITLGQVSRCKNSRCSISYCFRAID